MNLTEVFKKIEMALTPSEDVAPEVHSGSMAAYLKTLSAFSKN